MANSVDFRADQIQTKQIIVTGSGAGTTKLLIYGIEAQGSPVNEGLINQTVFPSNTTIGSDVFLYVSGALNTKGSATKRGTSVFGGDLVVSGSLYNGLVTVAGGTYSHTEGWTTHAEGVASHAEGLTTWASGSYSHAEGVETVASGAGSHAEGFYAITSGSYSHAEGYYTKTDATALYAHAEGYLTTGSGAASHAEGNASISSGNYSHAEGQATIAYGAGSHAEGYQTNASGDYCHTEGQDTYVTTLGDYSHAEGHLTKVDNRYAHAEGYGTLASNLYAHAEGYLTTGSGEASHAEGYYTTAIGNGSHAEGYQTEATGSYSHAEGREVTITNKGSYGHAEGYLTKVDSSYAHAEGVNTNAAGMYSHAEGSGSVAYGTASHAGGHGTIASGSYQTVVGEYNKRLNTTSLFAIGNGTGDSDALRGDIFRAESTGQLVLSGGISHKVKTQAYFAGTGFPPLPANDTYTLTLNDYLVIVNVTTGGPFDINLPAAATTPIGTTYVIRRLDSSVPNTAIVRINPGATDQIIGNNMSYIGTPISLTGVSGTKNGGCVTLTYIGYYVDTSYGTYPTWMTTSELDL